MLCPSLVAQNFLFAPSKTENQYFHLPVCPPGKLPSGSGFSSAAGEWLIYPVWKNRWTRYSLLDVLIISFLAFYFQLHIYATCWCNRIMKYFILEIILSLKQSFEVLTDATLGVILYPEVVLNKQISTFTITEIFLRISNLQHISPKL